MVFKPGQSGNPAGKPPGTISKYNRTVKDHFHEAFEAIQGHETANLATWAQNNPDKFYPLASKLIPAEITGQIQIMPILNVITSQAESETILIEGEEID